MKYFLKLLILFSVIFSCSNEVVEDNPEHVLLNFETKETNSLRSNNIITIEAEIVYENRRPKLVSDKLVEITSMNSETNELIYAYVLKSEYEKVSASSSTSRLNNCESSIEHGYGFTGRCFVYGTFYNGSNCESLFVPCGFRCIGFDDVCPAWNEAFA